MNLGQARSTNPRDLTAAFREALGRTQTIVERHLPPGEARDLRLRLLDTLHAQINEVGEDSFQSPHLHEILSEDRIVPLADWPLFVILDALAYCDASAKNGDGAAQSGMGPISDGLARLSSITPDSLTVRHSPSAPWTPAAQEHLQALLMTQGFRGVWQASLKTDGTIAANHDMIRYLDVDLPAPHPFTRVEEVVVLSEERAAFRRARAAELIGQQLSSLTQASALGRRIAALVAPEEPTTPVT